MGNIYTATFSAVAVSAAQDAFEIVAGAATRVAIRGIRLAQYSDAGDAEDEMLSVKVIRGFATSGSGGSSVTPANILGHTGAGSATSTVEANNTTVAKDGTGVTLIADAFRLMDGWRYCPPKDERIILEKGQRLVVLITAPADAVTMNGTLVFEELGQMAA